MNKKIKIQEVKENDININAENKNETAAQKPKSLIIKIEDLAPFEEHPYKVTDDENMAELVKSISEYGIMNPLIVRPKEDGDGKYEIISGHRRLFAAQKLGLKKMPCTVHYVDRDTATVMMVDSNCQRTELLPSEKAKAYKMKMDAMSRQGKRTDLKPAEETCAPVEHKSKTRDIIADEAGESREQIRRYIRLNYLIPELLQFVDEGKIKMRPAVEMSYLGEETQRDIVDCIDESGGEVFPSHAQTRRIREQAENGGISYEEVSAIMKEEKPNQVEKVKIPTEELRKRIGKNLTDEAFIKYLYDAVDYYNKYLQRQREQAR